MLSVIEDLGYITNLAARNMRSHAQNLMRLVILAIARPFAAEMRKGANRAIAKSTFYPLVYTTDGAKKSGSTHTNRRSRRQYLCSIDTVRALLAIPFTNRRCERSIGSFSDRGSTETYPNTNSCYERKP